jgi:hypothetical protein
MKLFKGLLAVVAFLVGITAVFSFKAISKKTTLVTRWTKDNSHPQQCITTQCTINATHLCGINGVFQDASCSQIESLLIKKQ